MTRGRFGCVPAFISRGVDPPTCGCLLRLQSWLKVSRPHSCFLACDKCLPSPTHTFASRKACIMAQDDEFRIKGAAQTSDLPGSVSSEAPEQPEEPSEENADQAEEAEEVSPDATTIWKS